MMDDLDRDIEWVFKCIADGGVRITIHFVNEDRTVAWPFEVPVAGRRLLEMHSSGEAQVRFEFPEDIEELQTAWPEECPYTEEELRAKIIAFQDEVLGFQRRVNELIATLPGPPNRGEGPDSIYGELRYALLNLGGEQDLDFHSLQETTAEQLALTPSTIRAQWIRGKLMHGLEELMPSEEPESDD